MNKNSRKAKVIKLKPKKKLVKCPTCKGKGTIVPDEMLTVAECEKAAEKLNLCGSEKVFIEAVANKGFEVAYRGVLLEDEPVAGSTFIDAIDPIFCDSGKGCLRGLLYDGKRLLEKLPPEKFSAGVRKFLRKRS